MKTLYNLSQKNDVLGRKCEIKGFNEAGMLEGYIIGCTDEKYEVRLTSTGMIKRVRTVFVED